MKFDQLIEKILKEESSLDQSEWDQLSHYWKQKNIIIGPSVWENSLGRYARPNKIIVPKEIRNSGIGSSVMQSIIDLADQQERIIVLTPSTDFGASSTERLKKFYKKFGFIENKGRNKDFTISQTMYRNPLKIGNLK
jgi:predicted GNAT family N-acyltransferase